MTHSDDNRLNADNVVDFIADIFLRRGADSYLGEDVTMSEHMLQCALLAERDGASDELITAALLHDIGHFTNEFPDDALSKGIDNRHDAAGAAVLTDYFPAFVVDCVGNHVKAKRYLCATDPNYFDRLSAASVHSLKLQGGPMSEDEVEAFGSHAALDAITKVRQWDEGAKVAGVRTPDFAHYAPILQRVVDKYARA